MGSTFVLIAATGNVNEPVPLDFDDRSRVFKQGDRVALDRKVDDGEFYVACINADSVDFRTCPEPCSYCDHDIYHRPRDFQKLRAVSKPWRFELIDYLERNPNLYVDCYW